MDELDLRVDIADADIRYSRRLWLRALDDDSVPVAYVERLHEDLRSLIHAQAQQIADDFRARRAAAADQGPAAD